ncbi:sulfatase-like hydrolase/transferase [Burkholderia anthina]|uniref:sulfatase family protein n=1 Tax=Burkholderia anthina TaxID=179879 RepID=UPI001CF3EBEA|nr:sulfatase [Burkholderia anthina]MCA8090089.1 sulfatase-like hydrolase/transferase [Burkholderia anthina]
MRLLYIDVDTLRPDHLGCYGYHRNTSPNIDKLAAESVLFRNVHASDTPCLPSRTALLTGRFGIHNGVVTHGGTDADPVIVARDRKFWSRLHLESFPFLLQQAGLRTVSVSSFAQRHSAFQWYAGFDEAYNVGKFGLETADEVFAIAWDWLARHGKEDNWFLHVHMWDPHTPYRAAAEYGDPFASDSLPAWLTESVRAQHWQGCGPHSARECTGFAPSAMARDRFPRQPQEIPDMKAVRAMFDGYDTGVLVADEHVGKLMAQLGELGIDSGTAVMLSSDHGETLGELNVYGDHQTADQFTTRVPMLLRWPELGAGERSALHYQIDVTATVLELLGQSVPQSWDGASFAASLKAGEDEGRDHLVVSQGAWTCQRGVRFGDWILICTMHDGYHLFDDVMLFNLATDPHEQNNLAEMHPDVVAQGMALLNDWLVKMTPDAARGRDPLTNVIAEGGPFHVRGVLPVYLERLRATDRSDKAEALEQKHARDIESAPDDAMHETIPAHVLRAMR